MSDTKAEQAAGGSAGPAKEVAAEAGNKAVAGHEDLEPYKPPPGEIYFIQLWHSLILLAVAFLLHVPFLIDWAVQPTFPVYKTGSVVVTGASTGIGNAAAVALAKKNYTVYATVRTNDGVKALKSLDLPNLIPVTMDVSKDSSIDRGVKDILRSVESTSDKPLIALINNAGTASKSPLEFHDLKDVRSIFDVNVFGTLRLTQKLLPLLRQTNGRIIQISSLQGRLSIPESGAYAASKFALEGLSDALRREVQPLNVSVSIIEPGYVKSDIHGKMTASEKNTASEAWEAYPHMFHKETRAEDNARRIAKSSPTTVVTDAVLHALTSPHPKVRYPVANVDDWPGSFIAWASTMFPDRLLDYLLLND